VILITYQMAATIGGPTFMSMQAKEARNLSLRAQRRVIQITLWEMT
jgi:hypothetical protein